MCVILGVANREMKKVLKSLGTGRMHVLYFSFRSLTSMGMTGFRQRDSTVFESRSGFVVVPVIHCYKP